MTSWFARARAECLFIGCVGVVGFLLSSHAARADSVPQQPTQEVSQTAAPEAEAASPDEDDSDSATDANLPPGHPPVDATASDGAMGIGRGAVQPSATVPPGTVEVRVTNDKKEPAAGITVLLQIHRESVAEGNSDVQRDAVTDANGTVRFAELSVESNTSYRLMLSYEGARYGGQAFQMTAGQGMLATMEKFALVRDIRKALVGIESMIFVEPKDDVFQFDVIYRLYNIGRTIWVPDGMLIDLPTNKQAFNTQQNGEDIRVESSSDGVRLKGTVPPGQHEVSYTFQLPRHNFSSASFDIGMPPNLVQSRVGVASGRNTELIVDGFPEARPTTAENGQRLLLTVQTFDRGVQAPADLRIEINGLPTLGPGRIVAASAASILALLSLGFAFWRRRHGDDASDKRLLQDRARSCLLSELADLEAARTNGDIGPKTYEETRGALVEALVRLEPTAS